MRIRTSLFFMTMACLSLCMTATAIAMEMTVVYEHYPPYEYEENGEAKGMNVDIIKEAFRRMGVKPVFKSHPWKRALLELERGEILALASGFKTPDREKFAFFPSEPLAEEEVVVIGAKKKELSITSIEDLHGLRVGVRSDYTYGKKFDSMQGLDKVITYSNAQMLNMVLDDRIDVMIGNRAVLLYLARTLDITNDIEILYDIDREPLYLFFSRARGKEAQDLADRFGKAVKSMRGDGIFDAILSQH